MPVIWLENHKFGCKGCAAAFHFACVLARPIRAEELQPKLRRNARHKSVLVTILPSLRQETRELAIGLRSPYNICIFRTRIDKQALESRSYARRSATEPVKSDPPGISSNHGKFCGGHSCW